MTKRGYNTQDAINVPKPSLQAEGLYRWREFAHLVPVSRETWRKRVKEGAAPPPKKLGERCTYWHGAELLTWLKDPTAYRAEAD